MGIKSSLTACPVGSILWHSGAVSGGLFRQTLHSLFYSLSQLLSLSLFYLCVCCSFLGILLSWLLSKLWSGKLWHNKEKQFPIRHKRQLQSPEMNHKYHSLSHPNFLHRSISLPVQAKRQVQTLQLKEWQEWEEFWGIPISAQSALNERAAPWFTERAEWTN